MNPWLTIPLDEYEAHMARPEVDQAALMADILASVCETYRPSSLALLGCAGGLGLDRVDPAVVSRIVAIDINGVYAERARQRYARRFHAFSAFVADIERDPLPIVPVRLAIGSLVFEYVDPAAAMRNVTALIEKSGTLVTVIQLASAQASAVTPSTCAGIQRLAEVMHLRTVDEMRSAAAANGFTEAALRYHESSAGKRFAVQAFTLPESATQ
jgi:Methyltransferase domain